MSECRNAASLLDDLIDGTLDDARARAVRAHLRGCSSCNRRYEETAAIVEAAGSLEPVDPPASLWAKVEAGLDGDDAVEARRPRLWWLWHAWRKPLLFGGAALAAGAAALLIVWHDRPSSSTQEAPQAARSATPAPAAANPPAVPGAKPAVYHPTDDDLYTAALHEVERADAEYRRAIDDLRGIVKDERVRWRPDAAHAFDENLAKIDAAIDAQRAAVRRQPADVNAVDALHASYRKEIDYLQEAVVRGGLEEESL